MTGAKASFGTYLKIGNKASVETFATVAEVQDIKGPKLKLEVEDVTSHDSTEGWVERIGVLLDGGEVTFEANWLPGHATQSLSTGLLAAMVSKVSYNFQLVVPAASSLTWSFPALVTAFEPNLPVKGKQGLSVTLALTGKPTLA